MIEFFARIIHDRQPRRTPAPCRPRKRPPSVKSPSSSSAASSSNNAAPRTSIPRPRCSAASSDSTRSTRWSSRSRCPSATVSSCAPTIPTTGASSPACASSPRTSNASARAERMVRAFGWIGVAVLVLCAWRYDSAACRLAAAALAVALFGRAAPRALRPGCAALAAGVLLAGLGGGVALALDLLPALIAAFLAYLFARTLRPGRMPLVARAVAVLDGAARLADPAVARYARTLTGVWAGYQSALAVLAVLAALGLPLAVAALFIAEFFWRRIRLPQAPRRSFAAFACALLRAWPRLLEE